MDEFKINNKLLIVAKAIVNNPERYQNTFEIMGFGEGIVKDNLVAMHEQMQRLEKADRLDKMGLHMAIRRLKSDYPRAAGALARALRFDKDLNWSAW